MALADALSNAATRHRKVSLDMIASSGQTLEIKVPAPRSSTAGAALFADLAGSTEPVTKGPFRCMWHEITSDSVPFSVDSQLVGKYPRATAYVKLALSDIPVDPREPLQETWLDLATEVIHGGQVYEVLGWERSGMANLPPYIAIVVLASEVRRRA